MQQAFILSSAQHHPRRHIFSLRSSSLYFLLNTTPVFSLPSQYTHISAIAAIRLSFILEEIFMLVTSYKLKDFPLIDPQIRDRASLFPAV